MQHNFQINLIDITKAPFVIGSKAGDQVLNHLRSSISGPINTIEISLEKMTAFDACFVRNGIATFAKINSKQIGTIITNIGNADVLENLIYGFHAKQMPLLIKNEDGTGSMYGDLNSGGKEVLSFVYSKKQTTTSELAQFLNISSPNASSKLKKLFNQGYLHAYKQDAISGGIEYVYLPYFICKDLNFC
ncbi:hypothetical protein ACQWTT_001154 [Acinetobacter baumannii]